MPAPHKCGQAPSTFPVPSHQRVLTMRRDMLPARLPPRENLTWPHRQRGGIYCNNDRTVHGRCTRIAPRRCPCTISKPGDITKTVHSSCTVPGVIMPSMHPLFRWKRISTHHPARTDRLLSCRFTTGMKAWKGYICKLAPWKKFHAPGLLLSGTGEVPENKRAYTCLF